jgi:hypothetical protein
LARGTHREHEWIARDAHARLDIPWHTLVDIRHQVVDVLRIDALLDDLELLLLGERFEDDTVEVRREELLTNAGCPQEGSITGRASAPAPRR